MAIEIDESSVVKDIETEWDSGFESEKVLSEVIALYKNNDPEKEKYYKHLAFCLSFRLSSLEKNFFNPQYEITLEDGSKKGVPDINDISPEILSNIRDFTLKQRNPLINARILDLLWNYEERARKKLEDRLEAIKAYQESVQVLKTKDIPFAIGAALTRQLTLANQTQNDEIIKASQKFFNDTLNSLSTEKSHSEIKKILQYLVKTHTANSIFFSNAMIRELCENSIKELMSETPINYSFARQFLEVITDTYKNEKNEEGAKATKVRIAKSSIEEGDEKGKTLGGMAKTHCYNEAIKVYHELGGYNEEVDKLKVALTDGHKETIQEMEHHEVSQMIPAEAIEAVKKQITEILSLDPEISLYTLCHSNVIPTEDKLREEALGIMQEFPLQNIFNTRIYKNHLEVRVVKEIEEKVQHNIGRQFDLHIKFNYSFKIKPFYEQFLLKHTNFSEILLGMYESCAFKNDTRKSIFKAGIEAYVAQSHIHCVHTLCPFIEGMIRDMLSLVKAPVISIRGTHQKARDMGDMLSTLKVVLSNDPHVVYFLEMFYCEFYGYNFRNELLHGLVEDKKLEDRFYSDMLIFTIILLLSYSPKEKTS